MLRKLTLAFAATVLLVGCSPSTALETEIDKAQAEDLEYNDGQATLQPDLGPSLEVAGGIDDEPVID